METKDANNYYILEALKDAFADSVVTKTTKAYKVTLAKLTDTDYAAIDTLVEKYPDIISFTQPLKVRSESDKDIGLVFKLETLPHAEELGLLASLLQERSEQSHVAKLSAQERVAGCQFGR